MNQKKNKTMDAALIFSIANMLVFPQWILMMALPQWKITQWLLDKPLIPGLLVIIYAIFLGISMMNGLDGGFGSLEEVKSLFTVDNMVVAGWVHYLAFDLLIGSWILKDSRSRNINHFLVIPCLIFTFMAGPVGWGLYMILRNFSKGKLSTKTEA